MFKDPLIRRFISGSCFAAAFVWVAVYFFEVDTEVVWVLFVMSFVFVGMMMFAGLIIAPLIRLFRRDTTMLGNLDKPPANEKLPPDEAQAASPSPAREGE